MSDVTPNVPSIEDLKSQKAKMLDRCRLIQAILNCKVNEAYCKDFQRVFNDLRKNIVDATLAEPVLGITKDAYTKLFDKICERGSGMLKKIDMEREISKQIALQISDTMVLNSDEHKCLETVAQSEVHKVAIEHTMLLTYMGILSVTLADKPVCDAWTKHIAQFFRGLATILESKQDNKITVEEEAAYATEGIQLAKEMIDFEFKHGDALKKQGL